MSNIVIREDGCILIKNVRLSYPHLFQKWGKNASDKKKYSASFIIDKKTHAAEIKILGAHINSIMTEAFKGSRIASDKLCLRDGDTLGKDDLIGKWVLKTSEDKAPDVINRDKSRINEDDDIVYAGCYVNALFRPWVQNNDFGKRINANLLAVQFVKDGERFSGIERPDTDEAFGDISGDFDDEPAGASAGADNDDPFA
jgi:hypothetical protein